MTSWYGIFAPVRTPKLVVDRLHREIAAMVKRPEVAERLVALGIEPEGNTPQAFASQVRSEIEKWGKVVKIAKVQVE